MRTKTRPVPTALAGDPALAYVTDDDTDRAAIADACGALGLAVIAYAEDVPLQTALDAVASGDATCLVVRRLGDLAGTDGDLGATLDRIDADGIRLVALDVGLDTAAPVGRSALRRRAGRPATAPWLRPVETPPPEPPPEPEPEPEAAAVVEDPAPPPPEVPAPAPPPLPDPPIPPAAAPIALVVAAAAIGYASAAGPKDGAAAAMCAQREAIERRCADGDLTLLELVGDREPKDRKALDRPGLSHALQRLAAGEATCLVTCGLDHLSRSVAELGQLLRWIDRMEIRLIALDLDLDTATPAGRATAHALSSVGDWERERISERTRAGLAAARAKRHAGTGAAAERTAALHQRIAAMRADGMTLQAIADVLNAEGVPTQRGGAKWRPSSVQSAAGYKRPTRTRAASHLPDMPAHL